MTTAAPPDGPARVEGPAFTPLVKACASAVVAGVLVYGARSIERFSGSGAGTGVLLFLALLAALVVYGLWWILVSRTTVTSTHLHQTWWQDKRVALVDITQTKLILIPGLTWLIGPRLVVRTRSAGSIVFNAGRRDVIATFARISLGLDPLGTDLPEG